MNFLDQQVADALKVLGVDTLDDGFEKLRKMENERTNQNISE